MALANITTLLCCFLIVFSSCIVVLVQANASFSHVILYGTEECLMMRVPKDQTHVISGSFDVLDHLGFLDPVRVAIYNSAEKVVWDSRGTAEGSFSVKGTGKHWLCLENGLTHSTHEQDGKKDLVYKDGGVPFADKRQMKTRTIGFATRVKKSRADSGGGSGDSSADDTTLKLFQLTEELNENFETLTNHMSFMKAREMYHRDLHEKTYSQVVKWNILEICAVVVVTVGQVLNVWWILRNKNTSYY